MAAMLFLTALLLPFAAAQLNDPTCHVPGICTVASLITYDINVNSSNTCLGNCQAYPDNECQWWTYNTENKNCFLYRDCNGQTNAPIEEDCPECITGEENCEYFYNCDLPGLCQGTADDLYIAVDDQDCLILCKESPICQWYSFNAADDYCFLFEDCPSRNLDFNETLSGQKQCELRDTSVPMHKVWLANGYNEAATEVEVHDIKNEYNCPQPKDFPVSAQGSAGAFVADKPHICGGTINSGQPTRDCYSYNVDFYRWDLETFKLASGRADVASVRLGANKWWITGGWGGQSYLSTTEMFDAETGRFSSGPPMQRARGAHCMVKINDTRVFTVGGLPYGSEAYIYDFDAGAWEQVADIPETRYGAFCGLATDADGNQEIVVAAGWVSGGFARQTYIYNLDNDSWRIGPAYPHSTDSGASVAYGNSFLAFDGNGAEGEVYKYNVGNTKWAKQMWTTKYDRYSNVAFLIPDSYYSCGEPIE